MKKCKDCKKEKDKKRYDKYQTYISKRGYIIGKVDTRPTNISKHLMDWIYGE